MKRIQTVYQQSFVWLKHHVFSLWFAYLLLFCIWLCFTLFEQIAYTLLEVDYLLEDLTVNLSFSAVLLPCLLALALFLLVTPLWCGLKRWVYLRCQRGDTSLRVLFDYYASFHEYGKALWFQLNLWFRQGFLFLCFWSPIFLLYALLQYCVHHGMWNTNLLYYVVLFLLWSAFALTGIVAFYLCQRYFLTFYLWVEHPGASIRQVFSHGVRRMLPYRSDTFRLYLTMAPLFLLCLFVIPAIVILPYCHLLVSTLAVQLMEQPRQREEIQQKEG